MTGRKTEEIELRRRDERFRTFIENTVEAIWCVEFDQPIPIDLSEDEQVDLIYKYAYISEANDAWAKAAGFERGEELMGARIEEIAPPSIDANVASMKEVVRAGYNLAGFETVETYKSGVTRTNLNNITGIIEAGRVVRVWGTHIDITERKQVEKALYQSEEINRATLNSIPAHIVVLNRDGCILSVNDSWMRFASENHADLSLIGSGVNYFDVCRQSYESGDNTAKTALEGIMAVSQGSKVRYDLEYPCDSPSEKRWYLMTVVPFKGTKSDVLIAHTDITRLKKAEEELKESNLRFQLSFEIANIAICIVSLEGRLIRVNGQMCKMFGYSKEELEAMSTEDLAHPEDLGISPKFIGQAISGSDDHQRFTKRYIHKDGHIVWGEVSSTIVRDDAGNPQYFISYVLDITKRKQSEIELRSAFNEIEQLKNQLEAECIYFREEIKQEHNFENIVGSSDALKYILYRVEEVAPTDSPVLILGETGTGKELIARAIHNASSRNKRSLIKVNCAALSSSLIESELFGYEKGAFTGADARREGRFELADGANLFLDEIGEIPLELQAKLLRVLEGGEFERLGSSKTLRTDVRIIAASNRNLDAEVKSGRFREDLFYRINVFPITVPPLRTRKEDIPLLVNWFVKRLNRKMGKQVETISRALVEQLLAYDWPGNVRELENVIERAMITTKGTNLKLAAKLGPSRATRKTPSRITQLADVERNHIHKILEDTHWKIEGKNGAAQTLGLAPSTLRDRMKKLGIRRAPKP